MDITIDTTKLLAPIITELVHTRAMVEALASVQLNDEQKVKYKENYEERVKELAQKYTDMYPEDAAHSKQDV